MFANGKEQGKGILYFGKGKNEGDVFEGEFAKGKPANGEGKIQFRNKDKYSGETKKGLADGHGKLETVKGDKYDGQFKDGVRAGKGTETLKSGEKYEGQWAKGVRNGKGRVTNKGKVTYNTYKNGVAGKELKPEAFDKFWK